MSPPTCQPVPDIERGDPVAPHAQGSDALGDARPAGDERLGRRHEPHISGTNGSSPRPRISPCLTAARHFLVATFGSAPIVDPQHRRRAFKPDRRYDTGLRPLQVAHERRNFGIPIPEVAMILVAGSTGVLGFEICRRLRERGKSVRALVRSTSAPEKVDALKKLGAEIATGDLKDPATLDAACRGVDAVISTVTAITTAKPGDSFDATDGHGTINLVDAAKRANVKQFVFVSFETDDMPDAPLVQAKRDAGKHLRDSGMVYTILKPALFMESWLGPMLFSDPATATAKVYGDREVKFRYVAVADVAEVAIQSIDNPKARNAEIPFGGPEALSQRDAVRVFEEVFERPFTVQAAPEAALEAQWQSAKDPFSRSFSALMLGAARGKAAGQELPKEFAVKLTRVRDFVEGLKAR